MDGTHHSSLTTHHFMKIIITGSIAYDYLMFFPGKFTDTILPEHLDRLSVSFLVDSMEKRRGGVACNIAYNLGILGERPVLFGSAGQDFADYRLWLESKNVDTSLVNEVESKFTASFFCNTDLENRQIASFYAGAMADDAELSLKNLPFIPDLVIISPTHPAAMLKFASECKELGVRYIYDPGQQCARSSGDELRAGVLGAHILIVNDYEMEVIRSKTGLSIEDILQQSEVVIVTKGAQGSCILLKDGTQIDIPSVPEYKIVDPTGVGDAFRGGLMKGMSEGADWETCGRMGSVAATYCLEHVGGQSHSYTWVDFKRRYEVNFGPLKI
jgi:adenosine kinase